ncbi:hypothetical protein Tco_1481707, partial [Tanacetum coccineum]
YIYTDLYMYSIWASIETTENSGNFTSFSVPFSCAHDSPMQCGFKSGVQNVPDLGYVLSLGEDNNKDLYLLASTGLYRVAAPSRCGYHCSEEKYSNRTRVPSSGTSLKAAYLVACVISIILLSSIVLVYDKAIVRLIDVFVYYHGKTEAWIWLWAAWAMVQGKQRR